MRPASSRLQRMTLTVWQALRLSLHQQADLYHFHDPELIPLGVALKLLGRRVVYDVHELLPRQILEKHWIPGPLRRMTAIAARFVERLGAAFFDGIVAATPHIAGQFPQSKTALVQNFAKVDELVVADPPTYQERSPHAAYVGTLYPGRGVQQAIEAIDRVAPELDARLQLAGSFRSAAFERTMLAAPEWRRVEYWGQCDRAQVAQLLSKCRVGIVNLLPTANLIEAQPVKLYEYMAAGLPVVASDFPTIRNQLDEWDCGIIVDPRDPQAIADAVTWLLKNPAEAEAMGRRGRQAVEQKFCWEVEQRRLLRLYRQILGDKVPVPSATTPHARQSKAA